MASRTFKRLAPKIVEVRSDPEIMGDRPCIAGTRVPVAIVLAYLSEGGAEATQIYDDYPYLPYGSLEAVAAWAKDDRDHEPTWRRRA